MKITTNKLTVARVGMPSILLHATMQFQPIILTYFGSQHDNSSYSLVLISQTTFHHAIRMCFQR